MHRAFGYSSRSLLACPIPNQYMWCGTYCLLRRVWCTWRLALECERAERATHALEDARAKLGKLSDCIWRVVDLVRLSKERPNPTPPPQLVVELEWTRLGALRTARDELLLALREYRAALQGPGSSMPTGLA